MVANTTNLSESGVEKSNKKMSKEELKSKLVFDYVRTKLKSKDATNFLNNATESLDVPADMKTDLKTHYLKMDSYSELSEVDIDSLVYLDILPEIGSEIIEIRNKRQTVKNIILKEYNLNATVYDKEVASVVEKMSKDELDDHINVGELERKQLLKGIFGKKMPVKSDILSFLNKFNLVARRKKLPPQKQQQLDTAITLIRQSQGRMDYVGLEELFEIGIFSKAEKRDLVTTFIPSISIATALELEILSSKEVQEIKKRYIEEGLLALQVSSKMKGSKRKDLEEALLAKLHNQELTIDTNKLKNFDSVLGKFIEGGALEKIVDGYNNVVERAELAAADVKNYEDFEEVLGKYVPPLQVAKFQSGSTIVLKQKKEGGEEEIFFFEVSNNGKKNGNIILKPKGYNKYDKYHSGVIQKKDYDAFLSVVSGENNTQIQTIDFQILDQTDLKQQLDSGTISSIDHSLDFVDDDSAVQELTRLKEESDQRVKELKEKGYDSDEIDADERVQDLGQKQSDILDSSNSIESQNLSTLGAALDREDPDGKAYGLSEGVNCITKKGDVFTIKHINQVSKEIVISSPSSPGGVEVLGYSEFYEAFKAHNTTRSPSVQSLTSLFDNVSTDENVGKTWSGFEIKNDDIEKKGVDNSPDYDFLVSQDNKALLKIDKIVGDVVYVHSGEVKEDPIKDGDKKGKKETFEYSKSSTAMTLGWLENYIKKHKLVPRSLKEKNVQEQQDNPETPNRSGSFLSRIFKNNLSVFEIVAGSKLFVENIQSFLKEGTDEKSAQFALDFYGKFLPEEIKSDLVARVEGAQKKRMDDYLAKLKSVNSGPATKMIRKWLQNKDVAGYKLEAGALFMMENYGVLYAKELKDLPRFTWYEALGGKINDKLYTEAKEEAEETNTTFSEEALILTLLGKQCKGGYNGITRRSRVEKEYKGARTKGMEDEIAKGEKDAGVFRRPEDRLKGGLGELYAGNYPNAIGWMKSVMDKGGSYEQMNKIAFMMLFSDTCYDYDNVIIPDALKNFNAKGYILPITRFMSYTSDMDMMNNTILEVTKRLQELERPGFSNIYNDALKVKNTSKIPLEDKLKATEDFYDTYGGVITDILYKVNNGNSGANGDLNKLILLEKDEGVGIDGEMQSGNKVFSEYYDQLDGLLADADFGNEALLDDGLEGVGVSGVDIKKATVENLDFRSGGGWVKKKSGPKIWKEIKEQFNASANQSYSGLELNSQANIYMQRKEIKDNLRGFLAGILQIAGTNKGALTNYEDADFSTMLDWGIRASKDLRRSSEADAPIIGSAEVSAGNNAHFESKLDEWVDNIIKVEQGGATSSSSESGDNHIPEDVRSLFDMVPEDTKTQVDNTINRREREAA